MAVRSVRTKKYKALLAALPQHVQQQVDQAYLQFMRDPNHPGLQFKPIDPADPTIYSVRIGLHWRAVGVKQGDTIVWFWIGSHAEYDKLF